MKQDFTIWRNQILQNPRDISPLKFGMSQDEVIEIFGKPDAVSTMRSDGKPLILKYHDIELHFDRKTPHGLYLVYSDDEIELSITAVRGERSTSMKAFDPNYKLLDEMYQDNYYPAFLVDKVKDELQKVIDLLESGETDIEAVQEMLDEAVCGINDLQEEFDENDSEIETVARECIAENVAYILAWFDIPIDTEEAIRERDW